MVVSADDKGKVKVWNMRNLKCMQTIDFTDKVIITKLLDLSGGNKIAVLGSRITLLHLDMPTE
jgi:WD40 repeat protein